MDVTELMLAYRECARSVWNAAMRPSAEPYVDFDAVDAFRAIQRVLFEQLVLRPIGMGSFKRSPRDEPAPFLLLRPNSDPVPIMVNRPSSDGNLYWDDPVKRLRAKGLVLAFVDFHDWDDFGYVDLQHYKVRIESCSEHPHLVRRDALVDVHHAGVEFRATASHGSKRQAQGVARRRAKESK